MTTPSEQIKPGEAARSPLPDDQQLAPGNGSASQPPTIFGHPPGLFALFFAEMWERFSYYGMRALLVLYMTKGFLGYGDRNAYTVYGAYTALVYMTPFFGGLLADKLLGSRRAVVLGGLLMAAGHLMMTIENDIAFFGALALLIVGNGFFKPNISTIVGALYPKTSPKKDGGFTIFYMGINLGAAMSPLLCGYVGEFYGWHYGFGLATIGMLTGLAIFVNWIPPGKAGAPPDPQRLRWRPGMITQALIILATVTAALGLFVYVPGNPFSIAVNVFVGIALLVAGGIACVALRQERGGLINIEWAVYLGAILCVPLFALLVSGFAPLNGGRAVSIIPESITKELMASDVMAKQQKSLEKAIHEKETPEDLPDVTASTVGLVGSPLGHGPLLAAAALLPGRAKSEIQELAERIAELRKDKDLREDQYAALMEVVAAASAREWSKAEKRLAELEEEFPRDGLSVTVGVILPEISTPAGFILSVTGILALVYLILQTIRLDKVERERMYVVLVLTFFSILFWAFFEQAGSSVNLFTDRNVNRVSPETHLTEADVGKTLKFRVSPETAEADLRDLPLLSQEQLGKTYGNKTLKSRIEATVWSEEKKKKKLKEDKILLQAKATTKHNTFTITSLNYLRSAAARDEAKPEQKTVEWKVTRDNVGMGIGGSEVPASVFQAVNPVCILVFGILFSAVWTYLGTRGLEPSTPVKFALGMLQLGLGFVAFWYGAQTSDPRGMVAVTWLLLGYLLHTTGELCLSPVGLSMVTKLSPGYLVSTVMGMWFLATAFSQFLAAVIAQFTGVSGEGGGEGGTIPVPRETVHVYGDVFGQIAIAAVVSAGIFFALAPLLTRWMHTQVAEPPPTRAEPDADARTGWPETER